MHRKKVLRAKSIAFLHTTARRRKGAIAISYPENLPADMEDITFGRNLGSRTESNAPDHEAADEGGASGDDIAKDPVWKCLRFSDVTAKIRENFDMAQYDYAARGVFAINVLSVS